MPSLKNFILTLILLIPVISLKAQQLPESRRSSYYKFIYEIKPEQARKIHKKGLSEVDESWFTNLRDSIPNDSTLSKNLPQGDYLIVSVEDNQLQYTYRSFSDIQLVLHNNYSDLAFTLHDKDGNTLTDATARINSRKLVFNKKTNNYHWNNKHYKGMIEVRHKGFTSYFYIDNLVKKGSVTRQILFSFPLKYISIPVKLIVYLPYDIYRSIRFNGTYGLPYYIIKPFKDIYYSIHHGNPHGFVYKWSKCFNREEKWDDAYSVFSKPKYKPGDTVKVKTYVCKDNGKPYNGAINVYYYDNGYKQLGIAKHSHKGSYHFSFAIHDSLNFKLDNYISLYFGPKKWTHLASCSFKYEDYELNGIRYTFKTNQSDYTRGDRVKITAKGEDMNGYQIPDGSVELYLLDDKWHQEFTDRLVHIPDTLWRHQQALDSNAETTILIPDSTFPNINARYKLIAHFTNADNELITKYKSFRYWHRKEEIVASKEGNTLRFVYMKEQDTIRKNARLFTLDNNKLLIEEKNIQLPAQIAIDNHVATYRVVADKVEHSYHLSDHQPVLGFSFTRDHQHIDIRSNNTENLPFYYTIYKKNKAISRGYSSALDTTLSARNTHNYYLSVQYQWGGVSQSQDYTIPMREKQLQLTVDNPESINPGQSEEITIRVSDYKNRPVSNVDVTALGLTKKFKYSAPPLPYYGKHRPDRTMRNNYTNNADILDGKAASFNLDYELWNLRMQLDSISYYQFIYPEDGYYQTRIPTKEHETQVAPFVFIDGELQQAHIIWINNRIVYSSVDNTNPPYSFLCQNGLTDISIRTAKFDISIKNVLITLHKKNIISIDPTKHKDATVRERKDYFTASEKRQLKQLYAPFTVNEWNRPVFVRQLDNIKLLKSTGHNQYQRQFVAGPFNTQALINYSGLSSMSFMHEPGYNYEVSGDKIKMKSTYHTMFFVNKTLTNDPTLPGLKDMAWTRKQMYELMENTKNISISHRPVFYNPTQTARGNTLLHIRYTNDKEKNNALLYTLLFKNDNPNFIRINNGADKTFHDLEKGNYRLLFVLNNKRYFEEDSLQLQGGGTHYINVTEADSLKSDDTIKQVIALIESNKISSSTTRQAAVKSRILESFNWETAGDGLLISGIVKDDTGDPIPGATIMVENTRFGTVTNMDGEYELMVPDASSNVICSFIGFKQQTIPVNSGQFGHIILESEEMALDEVVVVAYGTTRKESLTAAVSTVNALQGRVAGVNMIPGSSAQVRIRGIGSTTSSTPLIIIDGVPYEGNLADINSDNIENIETIKDESLTAIYGSRAANGVIMLTLKGNTVIPFVKANLSETAHLTLPTNNKGLRSNFKDEAFWQPALQTDKNGEVTFSVTYPDDITNWQSHILAISPKGHTGSWSGQTMAFLPLSANLITPLFLTEGDSVMVKGKTLNYLPDSALVKRALRANNSVTEHASVIDKFELDSMLVHASSRDTISVQYTIQKDDYKDGEKRNIPVQPLGSIDNIGQFMALANDTIITWKLNKDHYTQISLLSNPTDILLNESIYLRNYSYLCNEQAASKLIGLLTEQKIIQAKGEVFEHKHAVKKLIKRLEKSRNTDGMWGWWSGNQSNEWVSTHVMKALLLAQNNGYEIRINTDFLGRQILSNLQACNNDHQGLDILHMLSALNYKADYRSLSELINRKNFSFSDTVKWYLVRKQAGINENISHLVQQCDSTLYGSIYWGEKSFHISNNQINTTLLMYQLLKDKPEYQHLIPAIRNYFFEERKNGYWRNTYYSSSLLYSLVDDFIQLTETNSESSNSITIKYNNEETDISQFPYTETIKTDAISIIKTGHQTVFAGIAQGIFNPAPQAKDDLFKITSNWKDNGLETSILTTGKAYTLKVDIDVKKDAEYIMLEIPIPAGCSYAAKPGAGWGEAHREYYKEKLNIYYQNLKPGQRSIEIQLVPRFSGSFTINPAKMESMYFPVLYGRNKTKRVLVK
ncbi:carboxypeptidase-like regulatory domain-containing protein [Carboxylicivirga sp. RSCT41]|uniref:carboxypeptidase-like regulatory domain-containing protein n=1 Tax=Carboxylicivirga agarovorans TaxID=3417570 RepID=UPI003D33856B